jgi:HlyD family secretion protein
MEASRDAVDVEHAAVATAKYNLNNTFIRAQVNGTIIARNITIGQTYAASLQTPTLFTMGQDLTKMQVDVAVGEPDIGGVRAGDVADFAVLAYPNRTFHGVVYQVRINPTTVNNVVTYDTVVYVNNKGGALYPGMTAPSVSIHVAKVMNALVVPIAALQYSPPGSQRAGIPRAGGPLSPWGTTEAALTRTIVAGRNARLFVLNDGKLVRVPVHVDLLSETEAAVTPIGATLNAGTAVVTADDSVRTTAQPAASVSTLTRPPQGPTGGGSH